MQEKTLTVQPGSLHGTLTVPPSKSVMQRICAAVWVRGGSACITNPGNSADDLAMLELMKAAGCIIHTDKQGKLLIQAVKADHHTLDSAHFGESGLAARMCIPILALGGRDVDLDAHDSLAKRPMHFFEKYFPDWAYLFPCRRGICRLRSLAASRRPMSRSMAPSARNSSPAC